MRVTEAVLRLSRPALLVTPQGGHWHPREFPADTRVIRVRYYRWVDLTTCYVHTIEGWSRALYVGQLALTRKDFPCRVFSFATGAASLPAATASRADKRRI